MRFDSRKTWIALLLIVPLIGYGGYVVWRHVWGRGLLQAAERAAERRDFQQASEHLRSYLATWPDDSAARLLAARAARRRGDFDEAEQQLALYAQANGPRPLLRLEIQLMRLQKGDLSEANSLWAFALDQPEAAEADCILEAAIESILNQLLPDYAANGAFERRTDSATMANLAKATDSWLRRRAGLADQVQGLVWRGRLRRLEAKHDQAVADLREALRLDADHYQARLHLALAILQQAPEEAETHLRLLHGRFGESLRLHLNLAAVCRILGRLDEANRLLTELLDAHPTDVAALIERGNLALDMDQPEKGIRYLRQALPLAPDEPQLHFALSRCLRLTGEMAEANRHYDLFLQLNAERERRRAEAAKKPSGSTK